MKIAKKWNLVQKEFREIDLFDFTSFFWAYTFLTFLAHCGAEDLNMKIKSVSRQLKILNVLPYLDLIHIVVESGTTRLTGIYSPWHEP